MAKNKQRKKQSKNTKNNNSNPKAKDVQTKPQQISIQQASEETDEQPDVTITETASEQTPHTTPSQEPSNSPAPQMKDTLVLSGGDDKPLSDLSLRGHSNAVNDEFLQDLEKFRRDTLTVLTVRSLHEELHDVRTELRGLRDEVLTELRGLRDEVRTLRGLRDEVRTLRGLMDEIRAKFDEFSQALEIIARSVRQQSLIDSP